MNGWRSAWTAAGSSLTQPALWPIALVGFLARGGLVLIVLPIVDLPSLVGLATFVGPASITPTGPTNGLIVRIALTAVILGGLVIAGTIAGAVAEVALVEAIEPGRPPVPSGSGAGALVRRVVAIRLISLLPLAIVFGIGVQRLGEIVYQELTLPTDLVTPMAIQVAGRAPEVVAAILVAWLFGETWAGIATRIAVRRSQGAVRALGAGLFVLVRRIGTVVFLVVVGSAIGLAVLAAIIWLITWSWSAVREALLGGSGAGAVVAMAGSTLLFVGCWLAGLTAAGALATWRAVAWTLAVGEDHRGSGGIGQERDTL